jgi:hypothetical protein
LPTTLRYTYADPGHYTIAVHTVDFAAHETTRTIEVIVE